MFKLPDLDSFYDGDLYLPWRGEQWKIAEPTAKESERLRLLIFNDPPLQGNREIEEMKKLMGETWEKLVEAGVGWSHLLHMGRTALLYFATTPDVAEGHWKLAQFTSLLDLDALLRLRAKEE